MPKRFIVLSIDGGGIRGLIPAMVLAELERRLAAAGKEGPLHTKFDLIAGTSTGGIIAAGLTAPKPGQPGVAAMTAADLVRLYKEEGKHIFSRDVRRRFFEALQDLASITQERYDAHELEIRLQQHLGLATMGEALTDVLITAYDIEKRRTYFFERQPASGGAPRDHYFWQAARATSAAPTYFEPARVKNRATNETLTLVDGGVFANDPAMCAFAEAKRLMAAAGKADHELVLVSLSTGTLTRPFPFAEARNWGPINWINPGKGAPIISILMHGQADATAFQLETLEANGVVKRYFRLEFELDIGNDDMDDASDTNMLALETLAHRVCIEYDRQPDEIVALLPK